MQKYKILFVCLGNICRSPAAEGVMAKLLLDEGLAGQVLVDSAGTSGFHDGELPDERMRAHGRKRGYQFCSVSRKLTIQDFKQFDLIIVMDEQNHKNVMALAPTQLDKQKVHYMTEYLQHHQSKYIPDPYYQGEEGFENVLNLLEDACYGLLRNVKSQL
ncbi:low molecular weight protein-tyrosine-phosphatase [Neisseria sp. Ec49-e6-T10]|uniref:low molecular weight protein-tyrosine-phosphatase n=1 Tax=Neisseria sp. Ec49-e6-T10 TaxID=3140744 RepID=UPI003EB9ADBE